ncbi:hypothetical protein ACFWYW_46885 [Nonomuraea sp. NPDC059023]|uniref:hypothetical protein n=1 Tax=unclassified Nonomuraea TaxID=2593643 RepID=UPI0036BFD3D1
MKDTEVARRATPLIGRTVRVTAEFGTGYGSPTCHTYTGVLLAIGRKQGSSIRNTMPHCLVIDATASGEGVPIIAFRSVASITSLETEGDV